MFKKWGIGFCLSFSLIWRNRLSVERLLLILRLQLYVAIIWHWLNESLFISVDSFWISICCRVLHWFHWRLWTYLLESFLFLVKNSFEFGKCKLVWIIWHSYLFALLLIFNVLLLFCLVRLVNHLRNLFFGERIILVHLDVSDDIDEIFFADLAFSICVKHPEQEFDLSCYLVRVLTLVNSHRVDEQFEIYLVFYTALGIGDAPAYSSCERHGSELWDTVE